MEIEAEILAHYALGAEHTRLTESDPAIAGATAHLLAIGQRP